MDMITTAMQGKERTFTELLQITKLSRKTLSLRLKELRNSGDIAKNDGAYTLNGTSHSKGSGKAFFKGFARTFQDRRVRSAVWVLMMLCTFSVSGYVFAMLFAQQPPQTRATPAVVGSFTMALDVNNVQDLHGWQALVIYDPSELKLLEIVPGGFVGAEYPSPRITDVNGGLFMNATDIGDSRFLVGGVLMGNGPGKNGNGTLATIIFGYFTANYALPSIAQQEGSYETYLLNSESSYIPVEGQTSLALRIID